jgi:hypothetical protein
MFNRLIVLGVLIYGIIIFLGAEVPYYLTALLVFLLLFVFLAYEYKQKQIYFIDIKIGGIVGYRTQFKFFTLYYSLYRYVDMYKAINQYITDFKNVQTIPSAHYEFMSTLLEYKFFGLPYRKINSVASYSLKVSHNEDIFVPEDCFWVIPDHAGFPVILRLKRRSSLLYMEIACTNSELADKIKAQIEEIALKSSIYKGKLLSISYDHEVQNEEGETIHVNDININFLAPKPISPENIVLEAEIMQIIQRNVFDFFAHSAQLAQHKVPLNRGLLFYGSPGTGKTFTCHYIYHELKNVTCIVASGQSLVHIKSVCNIARMLQPTLVILEDVDLVFASREINLYSSALGELMDQLDGFKPDDNIVFILTTNSLDRMEKAIKDRPGRINQIVYFDLPNRELRLRYLKSYLSHCNTEKIDFENLSKKIDGVSQAFIKDWVFRAIQVALENKSYEKQEIVVLEEVHFDISLKEIIKYNNHAAYSIVGYKNEVL